MHGQSLPRELKLYCRKVLWYLRIWHPQFRTPPEIRHSPNWSDTTYSPRSSVDSYSDQSELEEESDEESSGDTYDGDIESGAENEESSNEEEETNNLHILLPNLKM